MPEPTTTTKPTSITEAVQQWKARMAETLARSNQLDDAIAALIQERDDAIAQRREPDKKISDALTAVRLDLGGISLLMDGASIPQGIEAYRGGDDGDSETQARVRILIRERNEARGSERILSQLLGEAAKRLGLNPTSFEPPHVLQMIDRWRMDLDQMAQVEALLRANTSGRIYAVGPGAPTLLGIAREAVEDLKAGQSWKRDSEALQTKTNAIEGLLRDLETAAGVRATGDSLVAHVRKLRNQHDEARELLNAHTPAGSLPDKVRCILGDLSRITDHVADCHTLLTERGGPMKPLLERIRDILNDRDQRATRMGEIQGELDTAFQIIGNAKKELERDGAHTGPALSILSRAGITTAPLEAAQARVSLLEDNLQRVTQERDAANVDKQRLSQTLETVRATVNDRQKALEKALRLGEAARQEAIAIAARVQAAQKLLESYMPRRGSMVEKAIRALQGNDSAPDRTREPIFPTLASLWDDEPHHPSPPIPEPEGQRQAAIDAEDRRILASAGKV